MNSVSQIFRQFLIPITVTGTVLLVFPAGISGQQTALSIYKAVPDIETDMNLASELYYPLKCALLGDSLLVLDSRAKKVVIFNAETGEEIGAFGRAGQGPGEFDTPNDIKVNKETGDIWILDQNRVIQFDRHGNYLTSISQFVGSETIALIPNTGYALSSIANQQRKSISIFDYDGVLINDFGEAHSFLATPESQWVFGRSIIEYAFGKLWQLSQCYNVLRVYDIEGQLIQEYQLEFETFIDAHERNVRAVTPPLIAGNLPRKLMYNISSSNDAIWIISLGPFRESRKGGWFLVIRIDPSTGLQNAYSYSLGTLMDIEVLEDADQIRLVGIDAFSQQIVWLKANSSHNE